MFDQNFISRVRVELNVWLVCKRSHCFGHQHFTFNPLIRGLLIMLMILNIFIIMRGKNKILQQVKLIIKSSYPHRFYLTSFPTNKKNPSQSIVHCRLRVTQGFTVYRCKRSVIEKEKFSHKFYYRVKKKLQIVHTLHNLWK